MNLEFLFELSFHSNIIQINLYGKKDMTIMDIQFEKITGKL